jgi:TolA-binding protein
VPKPIQYGANSIIYFKGDVGDKIYILNSGKVSLKYTDIETGQEVRDLIKMGEFFGVKSALGRYPREEDAMVLQDSAVMAFTVPEFEALALKNTRIVTKMMKVFSNQLRRIQHQVQNLMAGNESVNPETGLYKIGEYYLKNKRYQQALHAYKRYLVYYPSGAYAAEVAQKVAASEDYLAKYSQGAAAAAFAIPPSATPSGESTKAPGGEQLSDAAQAYYNAVSLVSQEKYADAFKGFKKIIESGDGEYSTKAEFEMAKCLFYLKQYDSCVRTFSAIVQKFPKHPDLREALFFVGRSYEELGDKAKAGGLYKKILTLAPEDDAVVRKAKKALKAMEGGA